MADTDLCGSNSGHRPETKAQELPVVSLGRPGNNATKRMTVEGFDTDNNV